jgi:hypothetical protein
MKQTIYAMSVVVALALSGCGSNSSIDPAKPVEVDNDTGTVDELNVSTAVVVINEKEISLSNNSQTITIPVKVYDKNTNAPYKEGKVRVKLPSKVLEGTDVGYFNEYEVDVSSSGIAEFTYTGPQDLKKEIDSGNTESIFEFYHVDNPTQKADLTVKYEPTSDYVPVNYTLSSVSDNNKYVMGLKETKSFTIYLKDDSGNLIDNADIKKITINDENVPVGTLINPSNNEKTDSLVYEDDDAVNTKSFTIDTDEVSGLLPIDIKVDFKDANDEMKSIEIKMNITVFSGPATALSISYAGVEADTAHAKFIEKFVITATDAYNNPVNTKPFIATGAMVEYAVDGSSDDGVRDTTSPRLWHGKFDDYHGKIEPTGDNKAQFEVGSDVFKYVDYDNDKMVVFGAGYVYEALGKWDIEQVSDSVIGFKDNYFGQEREDLFYAVGHNNRQDLCADDGREYVGTMKSDTYQLDDTGSVLVEFNYDYHLTGKDIMVWVNFTGYQADNADGNKSTRIGEARKHTLRGMGLTTPNSYTIPKETDDESTYRFNIHHQDVAEWYQNGHFGFVVTGKCTVGEIIDWSNYHDARSCSNEGVAYVDINVSNPSDNECVVSLGNIVVSPEF